LKGICTAQGSAVAEAAAYAAGPGIHPVVAFRALTENVYAPDARVIDPSWSPASTSGGPRSRAAPTPGGRAA
jgi:hypothetical protein